MEEIEIKNELEMSSFIDDNLTFHNSNNNPSNYPNNDIIENVVQVNMLDTPNNTEEHNPYNFDIIKILEYVVIVIGLVVLFFVGKKIYSYFNRANILTSINNNDIITKLKNNSEKYKDHSSLVVSKNSNKSDDNMWININYEDYYINTMKFANSLKKWLPKDNNKIIIIGNSSPGLYYAYLGSISYGYEVIILEPRILIVDLQKIISDNKCCMLVVEGNEQLDTLGFVSDYGEIEIVLYYSPIDDSMIETFSKKNITLISFGKFIENANNKYINNISENKTAVTFYRKESNNIIQTSMTHRDIYDVMMVMIDTIGKSGSLSQHKFMNYLPIVNTIVLITDIYIPIFSVGTVWFSGQNSYKIDDNMSNIMKTIKVCKPTFLICVTTLINTIGWKLINGESKKNIGVNNVKFILGFKNDVQTYSNKIEKVFNSNNLKIHKILSIDDVPCVISMTDGENNMSNYFGKSCAKRIKTNMKGSLMVHSTKINDWVDMNMYGSISEKNEIILSKSHIVGDKIINMIDKHVYVMVIDNKANVILEEDVIKDDDKIVLVFAKEKNVNYVEDILKKNIKKKFLVLSSDDFMVGDELDVFCNINYGFIIRKYKNDIVKLC